MEQVRAEQRNLIVIRILERFACSLARARIRISDAGIVPQYKDRPALAAQLADQAQDLPDITLNDIIALITYILMINETVLPDIDPVLHN